MSEISSDNPIEWLAMTLTAVGTFGILCLIIYLLNRRRGKFKLADLWRIMSNSYGYALSSDCSVFFGGVLS